MNTFQRYRVKLELNKHNNKMKRIAREDRYRQKQKRKQKYNREGEKSPSTINQLRRSLRED